MRILLPSLVLLPLLGGCVIDVEEGPISPAPFPDDETTPTSPQGIDVGEPNPNAPRDGFRRDYEGEWCYYEDEDFEGRVLGDEKAFNETWSDFIACQPDADKVAYRKIDWEREFVIALIAPPSGCLGAELDAVRATAEDGSYEVEYDHDPPSPNQPCAAAMSRPIEFISIDRHYADELDVTFSEVEA